MPFVQGQLRNEKLSCTIQSECGHCRRPVQIGIDSELNFQVEPGAEELLVYSPQLDIQKLEPSIIDGF